MSRGRGRGGFRGRGRGSESRSITPSVTARQKLTNCSLIDPRGGYRGGGYRGRGRGYAPY